MKKRYKGKSRKKYTSREKSLSLSVILLAGNQPGLAEQMAGSLLKIKKILEKEFEVLISTTDAEGLENTLRQKNQYQVLFEKSRLTIFKEATFSRLAGAASYDNLLLIEVDRLDKVFPLESYFSLSEDQLLKSPVLFSTFSREEKSREDPFDSPVIMIRKPLAAYLAGTFPCEDYRTDLIFLINQLGISWKEQPVTLPQPITISGKSSRGLLRRTAEQVRRNIRWNFVVPIKEYKSKPERTHSFLRGPSFYRLIFFSLSVILLVLLPVMSQQAGLSGDEEKHYNHAVKVYNYFATGGEDRSALSDPQHKLNYYGQSFDLFTYVFNRIFNVENPYKARHAWNAIAGFFAMFFSGLLAAFLMGYRAGVITLVLMFFAPRFLGHTFNNPMDIPFALGYIFTIYQLMRFLNKLPRFSPATAVWITLGIACTISIRIGGLMLIPYAFAFAGLYLLVNKWPFKTFSKEYFSFAWKGIVYLLFISLAAYLLSLVLWPYGLQKPFSHPFEALRMMSNITVSIRVLFDGAIHWSNQLPWYYISKNILYTVPVLILAGFVVNVFLLRWYRRWFKPVYAFFLFFAVLFPLAYVIYRESNVYGGWRHLLFVFPPMAVLAAISFETLLRRLRPAYLKYVVAGLLFVGILHPARHIFANHPFEYIYFNEIMGGTNAAYGRFETDYYLNSLKQGSEWLIEHVSAEMPDDRDEKIAVAGNAAIGYYFRNHRDQFDPFYTRYYDRGSEDWDYAVFFCNYISPDQLKNNYWPPYNTIHTILVDSVPVCAVVKRESKKDYRAIQMIDQGNYLEGIPLLEEAVAREPLNEIALLKLSGAYISIQEYDKAIETARKCLAIYPQYDKALNMMGIAYLNKGETSNAINTFIEIIRINYRFVSAYHNLGLAYVRQNDIETAKNYFLRAIEVNQGFKPAYLALAEIYSRQGLTEEANRYMQMANAL